MEARACTGEFRVHCGKWTTPRGMTPQQCTYCEWCISNKCVQLEEGYTQRENLNNCSCDCPLKETHTSIEPYNCGGHRGWIGGCSMGTCGSCFKNNSTTSTMQKYCRACSALFAICDVCGITSKGQYPLRPIYTAKMFSVQNGRADDSSL
jgi:hypothetical protein